MIVIFFILGASGIPLAPNAKECMDFRERNFSSVSGTLFDSVKIKKSNGRPLSNYRKFLVPEGQNFAQRGNRP